MEKQLITIERLKILIDEANYPYFDEEYLIELVNQINQGDADLQSSLRELCMIKAGIEEIRLGDVVIPSPRNHFLILANKYRSNGTGVNVGRLDGRK